MPNRASRQSRNRSRNNRRRNRNQPARTERAESPDNMKMLQEELRSSAIRSGEKWDCPVCLDTLNPKKFIFTNCSHKICSKCFNDTRISKCPICREDMGKGDVVPEWESESEEEEIDVSNIADVAARFAAAAAAGVRTLSVPQIVDYSVRQDDQMAGRGDEVIGDYMEPPEANPELDGLLISFEIIDSVSKETLGHNTMSFLPTENIYNLPSDMMMDRNSDNDERFTFISIYIYAELYRLGDITNLASDNIYVKLLYITNCWNGIHKPLKEHLCSPYLLLCNPRCIDRFCDDMVIEVMGREQYTNSVELLNRNMKRFPTPVDCYEYYRTAPEGRSCNKKKKILKEQIAPLAICKIMKEIIKPILSGEIPSIRATRLSDLETLHEKIRATIPLIAGAMYKFWKPELDEDPQYFFDFIRKYLKHLQRLFICPPVMGAHSWSMLGLTNIDFIKDGSCFNVDTDNSVEALVRIQQEYNLPTDLNNVYH